MTAQQVFLPFPSLFTFGCLCHWLFFGAAYLEGIVVSFLNADGVATFVAAMCLVEVWADAIGTTFLSTLSDQR